MSQNFSFSFSIRRRLISLDDDNDDNDNDPLRGGFSKSARGERSEHGEIALRPERKRSLKLRFCLLRADLSFSI